MYTQALLFVAVAGFVSAAPPDVAPECLPAKDTETELAACCKMVALTDKESVLKECMAISKPADKPGETFKAEGFDCFDDCIFTKAGFMGADKKLDTAKITATTKTIYTGDWATVGSDAVKKCLEQAGTAKGMCPSGADEFAQCFFRETYMNCPAKSWTESANCKANIERLKKCPKALPFLVKKEKP